MTVPKQVAALITARRLETVPADIATARQRLECAREKLATIASLDVEVAYVTAYDAARIAVTAHMLAAGYRVRATTGAHEAVGIYAEASISTPSAREFKRMRRRRNKAEYDDIVIG